MDSRKRRILFFGRTGSGKSTLANILFNWDPNPTVHKFATSAGIRGKTVDIQREESRDFVIVDTVGFGETEGGTVSHEEAKNVLYDFFLKARREEFNYIAYVHKWGKVDLLDTKLWKFFTEAFSGSHSNFILIFTRSKPEDILAAREDIEKEFHPCTRFVSVDFPEDPSRTEGNFVDTDKNAMLKRKRNLASRKRSFERLAKGLEEYYLPPVIPPLLKTLSRGRILLIGRCSGAKRRILEMLVTGCTGILFSETETPALEVKKDPSGAYEEAHGRGWEVVNATPFESYHSSVFNRTVEDGAMHIMQMMVKAISHGLYNHIVYVEEVRTGLKTSKLDKLVWEMLTRLLRGPVVEEHLVALIANVSTKKFAAIEEKAIGVVSTRFNKCKIFLYLDLPEPLGSSPFAAPQDQKAMQTWKSSLRSLEELLSASLTDRVGIFFHESFDTQESEKWEQMSRYVVPLVKGMQRPKLQWLQELDPLSTLSKTYREIISSNDSTSLAPPVFAISASTSPASFKVSTTQVVFGYRNFPHLYLQLWSEVDHVKEIIVEVSLETGSRAPGCWGQLMVFRASPAQLCRAILKTGTIEYAICTCRVRNKSGTIQRGTNRMIVSEEEQGRSLLGSIRKGDTIWFDLLLGFGGIASCGVMELIP